MSSPLQDPVPLTDVRRALVTKLRHHGDVLLASPVFTTLARAAPHVEIDALVYAETAPMLEGHPSIALLHTIDRDWKRRGVTRQAVHEIRLARALRARRYDLLIHLTHFYRLPRATPRHAVEANLDALRRIGVYPSDDDKRLVLVPGAPAHQRVDALLAQHGLAPRGFVQIHPGSRWLFKCAPASHT